MKFFILIITVCVGFLSCQTGVVSEVNSNDSTVIADTANYTSIQWIDSVKDIGLVEKGKVAAINFKFKNSGDKPLLIISVKPGCGCTVADYPKNAIVPNGEGILTANYDSDKGSMGEFRKSISVTTNTKNGSSHYIFFHGEVVAKGDSALKKKPKPAASVLQ